MKIQTNIANNITTEEDFARILKNKLGENLFAMLLSRLLTDEPERKLIKTLADEIINQQLNIEEQDKTIKEQQSKIDRLKLALKTLQTKVFGRKTEKREKLEKQKKSQKAENPTDNKEKKKKSKSKKKKNYKNHPVRKPLPEDFPRIVIEHETGCSCDKCGKEYVKTSMCDYSEELGVKIVIFVMKHKRVKFIPDCKCEDIPKVYTSPKIGSVVYKGKYANSLINFLLMNKYYMQVPIHRQLTKLLNNYGSELREGTINGIFKFLHSQVLQQLYAAIKVKTLQGNHFFGDETSWKVFEDKHDKKTFNHWVWVVASQYGVLYIHDPTRSKSVVMRVFPPDANGIINVDRYAAYNALPENVRRAFSWIMILIRVLG